MAIGAIAFPAFWLLVSFSVRGGTIEANLPPGTDIHFLLVLLLVGTLMTMVYTAFGYRDHVFPYSLVSSIETQGADIADAKPVNLREEDRPPG
ncbi:MAG TPA: hypothetical protein VNA30_01320 [Mycobacteriales bacterium]|nr:hypothetical protein [Mycobacteriales bacterium]